MQLSQCPECGSDQLFRSVPATAYGGSENSFSILPGLGSRLQGAKFTVVCCKDCGLTRIYATTEARNKLGQNDSWRRLI